MEHGVGASPILDLARHTLPLDSAAVFGRDILLEVEIGSGKGRFLLEWAAAHPDIGVLAVERARAYLLLAAQRAARRGLGNVRLVHTTAEDLLFRCLAPASVTAIHVYFPDPWPKKRHHKRRFFRAENVRRLAEVLRPGGLLRVKTDHADYAAVIGESLAAEPLFDRAEAGESFAEVPPSSFEIKYACEQRPVFRFAARRREGT